MSFHEDLWIRREFEKFHKLVAAKVKQKEFIKGKKRMQLTRINNVRRIQSLVSEEPSSMVNRSTLKGLKKDLNRARVLSIVSALLTIVFYAIGIGFKGSLVCSVLAVFSTRLIESSIMIYERL